MIKLETLWLLYTFNNWGEKYNHNYNFSSGKSHIKVKLNYYKYNVWIEQCNDINDFSKYSSSRF